MRRFSRRDWLKLAAQAGVAIPLFSLVGCGRPESQSRFADSEDGETTTIGGASVTMHDLIIEGWSTLGSGYLGQSGVLKAEAIKANKELTLDYIQDPHGHTFVVTKEHLSQLRHGKAISIMTTEAEGHRHEVRIDPKKFDSSSPAVSMFIDPIELGDRDDVFVKLGNGDDHRYYIATSTNVDKSSVTYCEGDDERCAPDADAWISAPFYKDTSKGRPVFAEPTNIGSSGEWDVAERMLQVRAKINGRMQKHVFRIIKKTEI